MTSGASTAERRRPSLIRLATRATQPIIVAAVFAGTWLLRFNDPEGSLGGLTDDHYFYLVRGWQMLYGDLPDRDFVDPGAPLTFVLGALTQLALGRGTWSEVVFCVTALSLASALTYWIARRASGSTLLGLAAAAFEFALLPRFYNYPKVLVYAVAIPALWAYIDRPTTRRLLLVAAVTAFALLMRHDHGVFVGLGMAVAILLRPVASVDGGRYLHTIMARGRDAALYGALTLACLAPYFIYLQIHGGIVEHFRAANSWAQRDRDRAPLAVPDFTLEPREDDDVQLAADAAWPQRMSALVSWNREPWLFWLMWALPVAAATSLLGKLAWVRIRPVRLPAVARDRKNPAASPAHDETEPPAPLPQSARGGEWLNEQSRMWVVTALAVALNIGFLRGNLSVRFGDVAVPQAVLLAWLAAAWLAFVRSRVPLWLRLVTAPAPLAAALVTAILLVPTLLGRLEDAHMDRGYLAQFRYTTARLQQLWPLEGWVSSTEPGPMKLALYVRDCTTPQDRVFISPYLQFVPALAQRAFAGGHPDLRPSFFITPGDQRLTIARLEKYSVPIIVMPPADEYGGFKEDFPRIDAYLSLHYRVAGEVVLEDDDRVLILTHARRAPVRVYEPLGMPCFQ